MVTTEKMKKSIVGKGIIRGGWWWEPGKGGENERDDLGYKH